MIRGRGSAALVLLLGMSLLAACGGAPAGSAPGGGGGNATAASNGTAAATRLVRVNAGYAAVDPSQLPVWVAAARGFFRQNGLDVNLQHISGGSTNVQALIAGDLQFAAGGPAAISARVQGQDIVTIANPLPLPGWYLVTTKAIKTAADFRGKTGMGSKPGSSADQATRIALERMGYTVGKDVKLLPGTEDAARLAALESGQVAFAPLGAEAADAAVKAGLHIYANMATMGFAFPETAIDVRESYLKAHRDIVTDYVKAVIEADSYIKTNRAGSEAVITQYTHQKDPKVLDLTYNYYAPLFSKDVAPTVDGLAAVLKQLAVKEPQYAKVDPKEFVDTSVVDDLVKSGFVSKLYGTSAQGAAASGGSSTN
jgi:NitT/TauT family transport system substrate-binding protein